MACLKLKDCHSQQETVQILGGTLCSQLAHDTVLLSAKKGGWHLQNFELFPV